MSNTPAADSAPLAGRVALVTGASRGIGFAVARALVESGARVAMLARTEQALRDAAQSLGSGAAPFACDVGDESAVARTLDAVRSHFGAAPNLLVNNAGLFAIAPVTDTSVADFESTLGVNLVAPFRLVRTLLPAMLAARSGDIVTIGSIADRTTFPGNAAYAASKFGARAMHQVLRAETQGSGVRAILVSPSPVDTPIWDAIDPDSREGFTPRSKMLAATAVAEAVRWAVSLPRDVTVDELRLGRS